MTDRVGTKRRGDELPDERIRKKAKEDSNAVFDPDEAEKSQLMKIISSNAQTLESLAAQLDSTKKAEQEAKRALTLVTRERDELRALYQVPAVMPITCDAVLEEQPIHQTEDNN